MAVPHSRCGEKYDELSGVRQGRRAAAVPGERDQEQAPVGLGDFAVVPQRVRRQPGQSLRRRHRHRPTRLHPVAPESPVVLSASATSSVCDQAVVLDDIRARPAAEAAVGDAACHAGSDRFGHQGAPEPRRPCGLPGVERQGHHLALARRGPLPTHGFTSMGSHREMRSTRGWPALHNDGEQPSCL